MLIELITNNVEQVKIIHGEEDFDEMHLHQFENEVAQLTTQLKSPCEIPIDGNYSSSTNVISANTSGTTHQQIDEYSRRRTEQISEEVAAAINRIVAETQIQQQTLLAAIEEELLRSFEY
ncbi:unnamed protein product [Adineta ricciae]|uniref:Uncharacterized protein n=1 Tax=Adineta ricciae TaxID=249248 RepID=A0A814FXP0_ADIRI|nr:unnamed protein product [Adineta ricciae]